MTQKKLQQLKDRLTYFVGIGLQGPNMATLAERIGEIESLVSEADDMGKEVRKTARTLEKAAETLGHELPWLVEAAKKKAEREAAVAAGETPPPAKRGRKPKAKPSVAEGVV